MAYNKNDKISLHEYINLICVSQNFVYILI